MYFLIGAVLAEVCAALPQDSSVMRLKRFVTNMAAYDRDFTQEKVYLHLDNNGYFKGENIWFKAYVFRASTLLPVDLSKILYVELVSPDGSVWERKKLPITNGRCYGNFKLDDIFRTGFYEIRAYTRVMTNWDGFYAYSRVVPVFDTPKDSTDFTQLHADEFDNSLDKLMKRSLPRPLLSGQSYVQKKNILSFFPEGGHIIKGVANRVAYKLTDEKGIPATGSYNICDNDGRVVAVTQPVHDGMGLFELSADWNGGYAEALGNANKKLRCPIPVPIGTGCAMRVGTQDGMEVNVVPNDSMRGQLLGLVITCRGRVCYFDTLHTDRTEVAKHIPRSQLRDGIQQVTLFSPEGQKLNERLVWVEPQTPPLVMQIRQNEKVYQPFSPIALDFTLRDAEGHPLQADFSLSVQEREGIVANGDAGLKTNMLLCSDLKGYIHCPDYYFEARDDLHRQALDLLLMVQGWRRYEWKEMAGITPHEMKQPVEEELVVDGQIIDWSLKRRPKPNLNLNLLLISYEGNTQLSSTRTDSTGHFAFAFKKPMWGNCYGCFSATNEKDKRQRCFVVLNRNFKPAPRPYEPFEMQLQPPDKVRERTKAILPPDTFTWVDNLPKTNKKIRHLPPVKVVEKSIRWEQPDGARWNYLGGENLAKKYSSVYFNLEDELEEYLDSGNFVPSIGLWFHDKVATKLDYDVNTPDSIIQRGTAVYTFFDNEEKPPFNFTGDLSDFRSLFISTDPMLPNYLCRKDVTQYATGKRIISYLYYSEVHNDFINTFKKGMRNTVIYGYSGVDAFYSPDYRVEMPGNPKDYRRTLYWNPEMMTDKDGKAQVVLFGNARPNQQIKIDVQGIAVNGQMLDAGR